MARVPRDKVDDGANDKRDGASSDARPSTYLEQAWRQELPPETPIDPLAPKPLTPEQAWRQELPPETPIDPLAPKPLTPEQAWRQELPPETPIDPLAPKPLTPEQAWRQEVVDGAGLSQEVAELFSDAQKQFERQASVADGGSVIERLPVHEHHLIPQEFHEQLRRDKGMSDDQLHRVVDVDEQRHLSLLHSKQAMGEAEWNVEFARFLAENPSASASDVLAYADQMCVARGVDLSNAHYYRDHTLSLSEERIPLQSAETQSVLGGSSPPEVDRPSVIYGKGTDYETVRYQSTDPESLNLREQVVDGAEVSRLISHDKQIWDGATTWAGASASVIRSVEEHNANYGVTNLPPDARMLSTPGVISGEWDRTGSFITAPALAAYGSSEVLATPEIVAEPGAIRTTGYRDLVPPPTYADVMPPEVRALGTRPDGELDQASANDKGTVDLATPKDIAPAQVPEAVSTPTPEAPPAQVPEAVSTPTPEAPPAQVPEAVSTPTPEAPPAQVPEAVSTPTPEAPPAQVPEAVSTPTPEAPPAQVPEAVSTPTPEAPPAQVPEAVSTPTPEAPPAQVPEAVSTPTPEAPPAQVPEAVSTPTPEAPPAQVPEAVSTPTPEAPPAQVPEAVSTPTPEAPPAQVPEAVSTPTPEAPPAQVPEAVSTPTPEAPPAQVPEAVSTPVPEAPPAQVPEAVSTPTPEAPPAQVPEAVSTPTPEAPPAQVPEAVSTPTPEAPPAQVPEAVSTPVPEAPPAPVPEAVSTPVPEAPPAQVLEPPKDIAPAPVPEVAPSPVSSSTDTQTGGSS
ncbi:hypothetical protein LBMAG48_19690 [Phycisphaerae bacterium]|nr:hypothetical protein LBMAG48_19690 [Phycisphaerae bacterium]